MLTWDILLCTEWQVWPVSCTYGAAGGYVVGLMTSLLLFLADCVRIPPKPVASNQMFIWILHRHLYPIKSEVFLPYWVRELVLHAIDRYVEKY